ncbi:sensor histidine kinase [Glaciimonas sp. Gout2]|uniref:sensor histidine kinase n=1 Tax=unclassified Glaciimonas TaxID=2644401 RepID=UPI002B2310D7|nr:MULTISPECIES: sensor histidine kinase [unclassified Glaciimonas]MEB0011830.1 sensor histidine kinase [Glaciimonas sp. Cout2]MEB0080614.1 sensor histidine kinase [Glaciimonas sp. Gout2]
MYTGLATDLPLTPFDRVDSSPAIRMATLRQRKIALRICAGLILVTLILLPFAQIKWPKIPAFLATYQTTVIGTYLITAYQIYGHYKATRSVALLHLSAGCLYTAVILVLQFLSFPGIFIEGRVLFGGTQTSSWLWLFWHAGPAIGILVFAWSELRRPNHVTTDHQQSLRRASIVLIAALAATVAMVTIFRDFLPVLDTNGDYSGITSTGIAPGLQVLIVLSLFFLWRASRFRNVLHVWLGTALIALLCDNAITMAGSSRLSLGWYAGRFSGLISSSVMMLVYLKEINRSHQQSMLTVDKLGADQTRAEVELQQSYTQLRQLSDHQEKVKEDERKRIAREIHDELGSLLTSIKANVSVSNERSMLAGNASDPLLNEAAAQADTAIETMRRVIADLRPSVLDHLGVWAALEWHADQIQASSGLECRCHINQSAADVELDPERSTMLFRIVQESLTNVVRHAAASKVTIDVRCEENVIIAEVRDDGKGIKPQQLLGGEAWGILGMHERTRQFGGELNIAGSSLNGTAVILHLPLT